MDKGQIFRALHAAPGAFVIPNPWDIGTARLLESLGFKALATTSAGFAFSRGLPDGGVGFEAMIHHCREMAAAVALPVSADLEKGFGDAPSVVAETVRLAAEAGLVGCSIEDATGSKEKPLYDFAFAVDRVRAAVQAAREAGFPFMLTARTENFLRGNPDLADTIKRLQAFADAGADVLMAPGLPDLESVRKVCASVSKPVNFMAGLKGKSFSVGELEKAGVRRISLATSLYRAAMTGLVDAAREVKESGSFGYLDRSLATPELAKFMVS